MKTKSKKMSKSTFAIIIMAIAMVAMLAFGGTYAYFTATTANLSGNIKTGTVTISTGSTTALTTVTGYVVPGSKVYDNETIALTNASTVDIYVFAKLTAKLGTQDLYVKTGETTYAPVMTAVLGNVAADTWAAVAGHAGVYGYMVEGNTETPTAIESFKFSVTFNSAVSELHTGTAFTSNNVFTKDAEGDGYTALGTTVEGLDITVSLDFEAIQSIGTDGTAFADAAAAYAALHA